MQKNVLFFIFYFAAIFLIAQKNTANIVCAANSFIPTDLSVHHAKPPLQSIEDTVELYEGKAIFQGKITESPEGRLGNGKLLVGNIEIESPKIQLGEAVIQAASANMSISAKYFEAKDVNLNYQIDKGELVFHSNKIGEMNGFFPLQGCKTYLGKGTYSTEKDHLFLESLSVGSVIELGDSFRIEFRTALCELDKRQIKLQGIKEKNLEVADLHIPLENGEVVINEQGAINIPILYLPRNDASITIKSQNRYLAKYKFPWTTWNEQGIYLAEVSYDLGELHKKAIIQKEDNFYLIEGIRFRGKIEKQENKPFWKFDGEIKIESDNPFFKGTWFTFQENTVNPNDIFIPIDNPQSPDGEDLTAGLNFMPEYKQFYSTFLQTKKNVDDRIMLSARGGLTFDPSKQEFRIGPKDKLTGKSLAGNTVSLNEKEQIITSNGFYLLPYLFKRNSARMKLAGAWKEDMRRKSVSTNLLMALEFGDIIPQAPIKALMENFSFLAAKSKDVTYLDKQFLENVSAIVDYGKAKDEKSRLFAQQVLALGQDKVLLDAFIPATILLSNLNFKVNNDASELYSDTEVGLISIAGQPLNKMIPCKIVYKFASNEWEDLTNVNPVDKITILVEIDANNYFFIELDGYTVRFMSSFVDMVNVPLERALSKKKYKDDELHCIMGESADVVKFRKEFEEKYGKGK